MFLFSCMKCLIFLEITLPFYIEKKKKTVSLNRLISQRKSFNNIESVLEGGGDNFHQENGRRSFLVSSAS